MFDIPQPDTQLEALASSLAQSEHFRVLRRLTPHRQFSPPPADPSLIGRATIVDTETTGADPATDQLIELAMVSFSFRRDTYQVIEVLDTYDGLEEPSIPISEESLQIHGITPEMVRGKRLDEDRIPQVTRGSELIIAHSAQFDRAVLERRMGIFEILPWGCSNTQVDWAGEGIRGTKLEYLVSRHGLFYDAHRALMDCLALLEVLSRTLPSGNTALGSLMKNASMPLFRLWATGSPYHTKAMLSARRYRWSDGTGNTEKAWWKLIESEKLDDEITWLRANIYPGGGSVVLDRVDATSCFTDRRFGSQRRYL